MSQTVQIIQPASSYTPDSNAMDRHDYGIAKNRKPTSTGGGRAWSDDEEVYLLQTRLQKMPYKHIAAHLKKTELACRLHYHQLSHGSNRRKRNASVSSGSSVGGHSPVLGASIPSPIRAKEDSRSPSPPGSSGSYRPPANNSMCLPSIANSNSNSLSPRLPAILPKPRSMTLSVPSVPLTTASRGLPAPLVDVSSPMLQPRNAHQPLLPAVQLTATRSATTNGSVSQISAPSGTPSLRLDCSCLPPPVPFVGDGPHHPVDMARLQAVYLSHRTAFWSTIASKYGSGANPVVLEQAWRSSSPHLGPHYGAGQNPQHQIATPLTPSTSPDDKNAFYSSKGGQDKTRISAILGIDANPRSPKEREMIRRLEEERVSVSVN